MSGRPHFIVHSLAQACAALQAADEGGQAIGLLSPPGAVHSLGTGYFLAMEQAANRRFPGADCQTILDCGEAPGLALEALRAGAPAICLTASTEVLAKVDDIARQHGATLVAAPPDAIDLGTAAAPLEAARRALAETDRRE